MSLRAPSPKHAIGRTIEIRIDGIAAGGDGVGRVEGMVCFVPYTVRGDRVVARIVNAGKQFLRAEVCELKTPGPYRIDPPCPLFGTCGGCNWMHLDAPEQRRAKAEILTHALGVESAEMTPSPQFFEYRGRARLHFHTDEGSVRLGFRAARGSDIIDVDTCPILTPSLSRCLSKLRGALSCVETAHGEIQLADGTHGVVAHLQIASAGALSRSAYAALSSLNGPPFCSVSLRVDDIESTLFGDPVVETEGTDGRPFFFPAASFGQANAGINRSIAETIREFLANRRFKKGIELFAGAGNHSIHLAPFASDFTVAELDSRAVRQAEANLSARGLTRVQTAVGDALEVYERLGAEADLVVLNPPRTGHAAAAEAIAERKPSAVLYISCNPATLARDIALLRKAAYRVHRVRGFDMFPQTSHMEAAVFLTR